MADLRVPVAHCPLSRAGSKKKGSLSCLYVLDKELFNQGKNSFLPGKHSSGQIIRISESKHIQDEAGLAAAVSTPAIKDDFLLTQFLEFLDLH
jgi:hypothetical protein